MVLSVPEVRLYDFVPFIGRKIYDKRCEPHELKIEIDVQSKDVLVRDEALDFREDFFQPVVERRRSLINLVDMCAIATLSLGFVYYLASK